ncbi:MAG TPA: phosphomannomutase/phosphoglucomutase, partial [Marinobacter sp.]|nr:phosphomannomutase/phosphoglucomutase [Marinobacter sp.]
MSQSAVVILAGVLIAVLLQLFIVQPSTSKQLEIQKTVEADAAALRLNHYLESMQRSVNSLAKRPDIIAAVSDRSGIAAAKTALESSLPGIEGVHLFSYRDIPRTTQGNALLGFAGLELARKAETGQPLHPDAFPKDDQWFIQFATPVRNPVSNAVTGSLLVVFSAAQLNPLLKVVNKQLGGQLALIQTASGTSRTIAGAGNASDAAEVRTLSNPDWSVAYTPSQGLAAPID